MCPRPVPGKERRLKKICLGNKFRLFNKLFMSWKNWANRSGGLLRDRVIIPRVSLFPAASHSVLGQSSASTFALMSSPVSGNTCLSKLLVYSSER